MWAPQFFLDATMLDLTGSREEPSSIAQRLETVTKIQVANQTNMDSITSTIKRENGYTLP